LSGRETATTTIAHPEPSRVTVGVDTHGEVDVACALDQLGRHLATLGVATTIRATGSCWPGRNASVRSRGSGWKAPAARVLGWFAS
jgi:hypothetical protein